MLVVDFLILNRDRHGANIEVLRNTKNKTLRLAPLFDQGLSLLFNCQNIDEVTAFDVLADRPIQCFIGSRSAKENLKLIPPDKLPELNALRKEDRFFLFEALEGVLPQLWLDKIWDMIWNRWKDYESFCNSR